MLSFHLKNCVAAREKSTKDRRRSFELKKFIVIHRKAMNFDLKFQAFLRITFIGMTTDFFTVSLKRSRDYQKVIMGLIPDYSDKLRSARGNRKLIFIFVCLQMSDFGLCYSYSQQSQYICFQIPQRFLERKWVTSFI